MVRVLLIEQRFITILDLINWGFIVNFEELLNSKFIFGFRFTIKVTKVGFITFTLECVVVPTVRLNLEISWNIERYHSKFAKLG